MEKIIIDIIRACGSLIPYCAKIATIVTSLTPRFAIEIGNLPRRKTTELCQTNTLKGTFKLTDLAARTYWATPNIIQKVVMDNI